MLQEFVKKKNSNGPKVLLRHTAYNPNPLTPTSHPMHPTTASVAYKPHHAGYPQYDSTAEFWQNNRELKLLCSRLDARRASIEARLIASGVIDPNELNDIESAKDSLK